MHRWLWVMWTLPKSYYVLRITFGGTPPDTKKQVICLKAQADRFQIEEVPLIQPLRIIVPHYWIHGRPSTSAEFCLSIRRYLLYKHITGSKNVLTLAEVQRETAWSRVSSKDVGKKKKGVLKWVCYWQTLMSVLTHQTDLAASTKTTEAAKHLA